MHIEFTTEAIDFLTNFFFQLLQTPMNISIATVTMMLKNTTNTIIITVSKVIITRFPGTDKPGRSRHIWYLLITRSFVSSGNTQLMRLKHCDGE